IVGALSVMVREARFAVAVGILEAAGLPGLRFANLGDVFKSIGLVSSPVQERAQLIYAMSEELSHTVSQVDGVVSARVHVVLPENDLLKRNGVPSSASVFIRHEPDLDIGRLIPQIKTLVAGSSAGLTYEGVSIVPVQASARAAPAATRPMTQFMGIWLLASSAERAAWLLGALVTALLV
uniref:EscJ/YscJ/HrcJ family type III secretion inner membrane ring protein n=1 Tax=Agrobacterium tumefaciens TaxID=358 RepID=UPI003B9E1D19